MIRLKERLNKAGIKYTENAEMRNFTSFKAGGKAALLIVPESISQLMTALEIIHDENKPFTILGNGTNTLFKDSGYDGIVIKLGESFSEINVNGDKITAGGAALLSAAARCAFQESLTGMEFASGIPGSIGGAVFMNAGAYGGEMKDIVEEVTAVSPDGKEKRIFSAGELNLSYRHSIFEYNGFIIVSATVKLSKGDMNDIGAKMKDLNQRRNSKQPVNYPSAGSTFKRPEGYFAGKLIEDAGLKGVAVGGAQVSDLHSGFIINRGDATASDILELIALVQNTVYDKFKVELKPEVRIIG